MTARPQDVALPLQVYVVCYSGVEWNRIVSVYLDEEEATTARDRHEVRRKASKDVLDQLSCYTIETHKIGGRRANLSAALASAQAREEELRAEVERLTERDVKWQQIANLARQADMRSERLEEALRAEAALLRAWARESREGGWSTHQHDPMIRRATELEALSTNAAQPGETT